MKTCELYKYYRDSFKWFIEEYYGEEMIDTLDDYAEEGDNMSLSHTLNRIWFELPDNKFNIMENPKGWNEFLYVLEEEEEEEDGQYL